MIATLNIPRFEVWPWLSRFVPFLFAGFLGFFCIASGVGGFDNFEIISFDSNWLFIFPLLSFVTAFVYWYKNCKGSFFFWFVFWSFAFNSGLLTSYMEYFYHGGAVKVFYGLLGVSIYCSVLSMPFWFAFFLLRKKRPDDLLALSLLILILSLISIFLLFNFFQIAPFSPGLFLGNSVFLSVSSFFGHIGLTYIFYVMSFSISLFFIYREWKYLIFLVLFIACVLLLGHSKKEIVNQDKDISIFFPSQDNGKVSASNDVDVVALGEYFFSENYFTPFSVDTFSEEMHRNFCNHCDITGHVTNYSLEENNTGSRFFFLEHNSLHLIDKRVLAFPGEVGFVNLFIRNLVHLVGVTSDQGNLSFLSKKTGLRYGGLVCLDSSFPDIARKTVSSGADIIFNPSSVFGFSSYQFMSYLILSNIITASSVGRPIVKNTAGGDSYFISSDGSLTNVDKSSGGTLFNQSVKGFNTFYSRIGINDSFAILFFITITFFILGLKCKNI